MKAPLPLPRFEPIGALIAIRKERNSLLGSWTNSAGFSRTALRSSAAPSPLAFARKASRRTPSGADFSWRISQLIRVVGRPLRGASILTWQVMRPARRSAVTWIGPTVFDIRIAPPIVPKDARLSMSD